MSRTLRFSLASTALAGALVAAAPSQAQEFELGFYGGWQTAPHSRVRGTYGSGTNASSTFNSLIGWDGKSFAMPPYYGLRATWWKNADWGFGVEFSHTKVYSDEQDMADAGFSHLEFTDGLNIVTVNASRRWQDAWNGFTPYVSGGIGVAVPHVEVTPIGGQETREYQLTGPAARFTAGAAYPLSDRWSLFGEYQFTWSDNDADLKGDGSLSTTIYTNAVNLGVNFRF